MPISKLFVNGKTFVSHALLSFGDYDNSTDVERANVRHVLNNEGFENNTVCASWGNIYRIGNSSDFRLGEGAYSDYTSGGWKVNQSLLDDYDLACVIHVKGGYGSEAVYIREDLADDIIGALENYPCLNDDLCSQINHELFDEAFTSWIESDITRIVASRLRSADDWDTDEDEIVNEYVHAAMNEAGMEWHIESGGKVSVQKDVLERVAALIIEKAKG